MKTNDFSQLLLADRPLIMGVLNVTPDSFSDGGAFVSPERAIERAHEMLEQGADIIDVGGESTRPPGKTYGEGAKQVSVEIELDRVLTVIRGILETRPNVLVSIDTTKSRVADAALECGAAIVNDVSAGTTDLQMFAVAAHYNAPLVLMHGYGPQFDKTTIEEYHYDDVVAEVRHYLYDRANRALEAGVTQIMIDPGIGFAKGFDDNMRLMNHLNDFAPAWPVVLGISRKSSIGKALGGNVAPQDRVIGSVAAACYGVMNGAKIVRVHDVRETREALSVLNAIRAAV